MIKELVYGQGAKAKEAARFLSSISEGSKNEGLAAIAKALRSNSQ